MTATPGKAPKKVKDKRQTPQERAEALRYNHMMYGPTAKEVPRVQKKVNLGSAYLQHPKFQALMLAFKKGTAFQFDVTDKGKVFTVATDGTQILFDGKSLFYSRPSNRFEEHLLLDRSILLQYQTSDALVHLAAAVLRSMPELEALPLSFINQQFYYGSETLETGIAEHGPNLMVGSYKHLKAAERARK